MAGMPRITLPSPESMDAAQRAVYDRIVSGPRGRIQGPLRAVLHNAELADRWQALGALLRYGTSLPPRLSELAILVTGRACQSPFEWHAHRIEAEKAGLEAPIVEALLAQQEPPGMSPDDAIVWRYAVELNRHNSVADATHAAALARFGEKGVVELTALVGYYTMVAMTLNCQEIPLPEGAVAAFPLPQHAELA
jgi:4-carboxymuconolactone decarboxylase